MKDALRKWLVGSVFLLCALVLGSCGKPLLPDLDELIQRSSVIYIAEYRDGAYRVQKILKASPTDPTPVVEGQRARLLPGKATRNPSSGHLIIIFFEKEVVSDGRSEPHLVQAELPILDDNRLAYYKIPFEELNERVLKAGGR